MRNTAAIGLGLQLLGGIAQAGRASDSADSYTFFGSVICLSVCLVCHTRVPPGQTV